MAQLSEQQMDQFGIRVACGPLSLTPATPTLPSNRAKHVYSQSVIQLQNFN